MRIVFTRLSDLRHAVAVSRTDGSTETLQLASREFLRHDLAHLAIELEFPIRKGYWGCVASGASLTGEGVSGSDARLAESMAGPVQTLFRTDASVDAYANVLAPYAPPAGVDDLAARVHERVRQVRGHWKATPYGGQMVLEWPE